MGLTLYKQKRNFSHTPEPTGNHGKNKNSLSFVVQRHHASHLHYDFRLQMEGVLKSWAIPKGPSMKSGERRLAVHVEDHPLAYGKFSGLIPAGNYGAGTVDIWDYGTYKPLDKVSDLKAEQHLLQQLKKGDLKFTLNGTYLKGAFALVRMQGETDKNWLLIKKSDDFTNKDFDINKLQPVKPFDKKKKWPSSPEQKKKQNKKQEKVSDAWPHLQKPMLAKLTREVTNVPGWIYEPKYDGYRAITMVDKGKVEMLSRNGNSFTTKYGPLVAELKKIDEEVILDGEVVIENNKGISNFQLLQNYTTTHEGILLYYVFDMLFLNGRNLTTIPLSQRKEILDFFFKAYSFKHIALSPVTLNNGKELLKKLSTKGYEGILSKDPESYYYPGKRSGSWLKIKSVMMQEAVICGYTRPQNSRKHFGSIILGVYRDNKLSYIGNCGTGFTDSSLKELYAKFEKIKTSRCPFKVIPVLRGAKNNPVWLKPRLVCNVKFQEWTKDMHMRVPVFMGLRGDKKADEVVVENPTNIKSKKIKDGKR